MRDLPITDVTQQLGLASPAADGTRGTIDMRTRDGAYFELAFTVENGQ